jgi:hypothetical protein
VYDLLAEVLVLVGCVGAAGGVWRWATATGAASSRRWRRASETLGLSANVQETSADGAILFGELDGFRVHLTQGRATLLGGRPARLSVYAPSAIPTEMAFGPSNLSWELLKRVAGLAEVTVGEPGFDQNVVARGVPAVVLAVLDAETRQSLRALARLGGIVNAGEVQVTVSARAPTAELVRTVKCAVRVARRLDLRGRTVETDLLRRIRHDPVAEVRARCAAALLERAPESPEAEAAWTAATRDSAAQVRLVALAHGGEAFEPLTAMAGDTHAGDAERAEALRLLCERYPGKGAERAITTALGDPRLQGPALECAARVALPVATLLGLDAPNPRLLAAALGNTGEPSATERLIELLSGDDETAEVAARALGRVGTPAALAVLKARLGLMSTAPMREAVLAAVARLERRVAQLPEGGLALVDADETEGALSAVKAGGLSEPE